MNERAILIQILFVAFSLICISTTQDELQTAQDEIAYGHYNDAIICHQSRNTTCALLNYLEAIERKPNFYQAHQNIGVLYESGECNELTGSQSYSFDRALYHHRKSIEYSPSPEFSAGAWSNLVGLEMRLGPNSKTSFDPNDPEIQQYMLSIQGETMQPLTSSLRWLYFVHRLVDTLKRLPEPHIDTLFTLGKVYLEMQDTYKALEVFVSILQIDPGHEMSLMNVGNHYFRQSDFAQASEYYILASTALKPSPLTSRAMSPSSFSNLIMVMNNLAQSYRQMGRLDAAIVVVQEVLQHLHAGLPQSTGISSTRVLDAGLELWSLNNLYAMRGLSNQWGGRYEELEVLIEAAVRHHAVDPHHYVTPSLVGGGIVDPYTFSLQRYAARDSDLSANYIYCRPYQPVQVPNEKTNRIPFTGFSPPQIPNAYEAIPIKGRKIKVGYLSYDWRNHPMGRLTRRLVTSHNRTRFNVTSISYGPNDHSDIRYSVEQNSQAFIDIEMLRNDHDAYVAVSSLGLDVVVDLTAHTYNGRIAIAAMKPATLIINYLGYPGTTGCKGFDYSMVDKVVVPPEWARSLFSEQLIYLPYTYQANQMPLNIPLCGLDVGGISMSREERSKLVKNTCRLRIASGDWESSAPFSSWGAVDTTWLCTFNANKKLEPVILQSWFNLMRERPHSVLFMLYSDAAEGKAHLLSQAAFYGISSSRLVFVPALIWTNHLSRAASCDLVLDSYVYGAHTTSSDMLWMGVPLLAMRGWGSNRMPSRVAASITESLYDSSTEMDLLTTTTTTITTTSSSVSLVSTAKEYESTGSRLIRYTTYTPPNAFRTETVKQFRPGSSNNRAKVPAGSFLKHMHSTLVSLSMRAATFNSGLLQDYVGYAIQGGVEVQKLVQRGLVDTLPHIAMLKMSSAYIPSTSNSSSLATTAVAPSFQWDRLQLLKKEALKTIGTCMSRRAMMASINDGSRSRGGSDTRGSGGGSGGMESDDVAPPGCNRADLSAIASRILQTYPDVATSASLRALMRRGTKGHTAAAASTGSNSRGVTAASATSTTTPTPEEPGPHPCTTSTQSLISALPTPSPHIYSAVIECILLHSEHVTDAILHAQFEAIQSQQHATEGLIFNGAAGLFLRKAGMGVFTVGYRSSALLAEVLPLLSALPSLFNDSTPYVSLAPVAVMALQTHSTSSTSSTTHPLLHAITMVLSNHASALLSLSTPTDAALYIASALIINPTGQTLLDLGIAVGSIHGELGYVLSMKGVVAMHLERYRSRRDTGLALPSPHASPGAVSTSTSALTTLSHSPHTSTTRTTPSTAPLPKNAITIAIYCMEYGNAWWGSWGPASLDEGGGGLGGSEEAVVYLSEELVGMGYHVVVYGDPPKKTIVGGVHYKHYSEYDMVTQPDIFIAWRYAFSLAIGANAKLSLLWLHDLVPPSMLPPKTITSMTYIRTNRSPYTGLDQTQTPYVFNTDPGTTPSALNALLPCHAILVQSSFHRMKVSNALLHRGYNRSDTSALVQILPNGLSTRRNKGWKNSVGINSKSTFVYASAPSRGLEELLGVWGLVRSSILATFGEHVSLKIFYGFPLSVQMQYRRSMGASFDEWFTYMRTVLLQQEGVEYVGAVDHHRLTRELASSSLLLYPTRYSETGCITVIRAMSCGAIPVTSRYTDSVLPNLTSVYDLGPDPLTPDTDYRHWLLEQYVPAVLAAYNQTRHSSIATHRKKMVKYAREKHTWRGSARVLQRIAEELGTRRPRRFGWF